MKERPIIFSTEMVRAILEGRKTQTRRVIKPQPYDAERAIKRAEEINNLIRRGAYVRCPYGQVGDRLWVKETWATLQCEDKVKPSNLNPEIATQAQILYREQLGDNNPYHPNWRSPLFMPRWASRITLEITGLRVERLQDIPLDALIDEGIEVSDELMALPDNRGKYLAIQQLFIDLWDKLNAKRGYAWDSNPWVWVIEFKRLSD